MEDHVPRHAQMGAWVLINDRWYEWFGGEKTIVLEEEIVGLGSYGYTLTVLSSDLLADDPDEVEDEEEKLVASWTPRFAYGR